MTHKLHQEAEKTEEFSRRCHSRDFPTPQPPQLAQLAQAITSMFTALDFETQWTTVAATLVPKKPFPRKLSEFRPGSSLSTMRKLLGYIWLAALGDTQFNSFQASELAKEWKTS